METEDYEENDAILSRALETYIEQDKEQKFEIAQNTTVSAIIGSDKFSDLFDDCECVHNIYDSRLYEEDDKEKSTYFLFRAHDAVSGRNVALKVTNPIFDAFDDQSKRLEWESAVLSTLKNKRRCQQLVSPYDKARIILRSGGDNCVEKVSFFSSIYLPIDIKKAFFDSKDSDVQYIPKRLRIFISAIKAVQTLHRNGICHRDLKPGNFMAAAGGKKCVVVAIDLGSCLATKEIENLLGIISPAAEFSRQYAAPELLCGFSKVRDMAVMSDLYSLGCMLFELFDKRSYFVAVEETNGKNFWEAINNIVVSEKECAGDEKKRIELYNKYLDEQAAKVIVPRLSENGNVPPYIRDEIQRIIDNLCAFDYRKRTRCDELDALNDKLHFFVRVFESECLRQKFREWKKVRKMRRSGAAGGGKNA